MLHPSYTELMEKINPDYNGGEDPLDVNRYSIVIACAKRGRQIIDERYKAAEKDKNAVASVKLEKPLSIAVRELYSGDIKIIPDTHEEEFADQIDFDEPFEEVDDAIHEMGDPLEQ